MPLKVKKIPRTDNTNVFITIFLRSASIYPNFYAISFLLAVHFGLSIKSCTCKRNVESALQCVSTGISVNEQITWILILKFKGIMKNGNETLQR
jgi:hypothetical protein